MTQFTLTPEPAPVGLAQRIIRHIAYLEERWLRTKAVVYGFIGIASIAGIVAGALTVMTEFANSSFFQYLSLILTDGGALTTYWQTFALSLAESLPLVGIMVILVALTGFLWSGAGFVRVIRPAFARFTHAF